MSKIIFNPTNELLAGFHEGVEVKVPPGIKIKVPDARANHLLNSLGPRGLVALEWGDDEDVKAKEGAKRNKEFKQKQVSRYNYINEQRRTKGLEWLMPEPHLKAYAEELGIKLMQPWSIQIDDNAGQKTAVEEVKKENKELKETLAAMQEQLEILTGAMKSGPAGSEKRGSPKAKEA